MKILRILTPLEGRCYCGGQMFWAEVENNLKEIYTDEDGEQRVRRGTVKKTYTERLCVACFEKNSLGMPAECF